ncbi:MAG: PIG-L family deacetylase [Burkholderia sp.]
MNLSTRWLVISPHLDDGVFGCGALLARAPGSIVVTVFAGLPAPGTPAPDWDRQAGFDDAHTAMQHRRAEDRAALSALDATPVWLDFLDDQYGDTPPDDALARQLGAVIDAHPYHGVAAPAGLFHSDHARVHRAMMTLWPRGPTARAWWCYEEAIYRRVDDLAQQRRDAWRSQGWRIERVGRDEHAPDPADPGPQAAKARAVAAYASQTALLDDGRLDDTAAEETYWRLTRAPGAI